MKDLESLFAEFNAQGLHKELSEFNIEQHDDEAGRCSTWSSLTAFATGSVNDRQVKSGRKVGARLQPSSGTDVVPILNSVRPGLRAMSLPTGYYALDTPMDIWYLLTAFLASGAAFLSLWSMAGRQSAGALFLGYGGGWFLLYAVAAALPRLGHVPWREVMAAFIAFGIGGGIAGVLMVAVSQIMNLLGGSPAFAVIVTIFTIPFWLPWIVGAVIMYYVRHPEIPRGPRVDH